MGAVTVRAQSAEIICPGSLNGEEDDSASVLPAVCPLLDSECLVNVT
jgi:hypothetical protein